MKKKIGPGVYVIDELGTIQMDDWVIADRKARGLSVPTSRYEVGVDNEAREWFSRLSDASSRAIEIGGYVFDRMARPGKAQLWQAINGDLIVQSVRLPNSPQSR